MSIVVHVDWVLVDFLLSAVFERNISRNLYHLFAQFRIKCKVLESYESELLFDLTVFSFCLLCF